MMEVPGSDHVRAEMIELLPALRSFARRFEHNPANAEDLVQETLLRSLANLDKFKEGTSLKSWMFTILRNTFCTKFGRAKREVVGLDECVASRSSINAPQEWELAAHEFHKAMLGLPKHYREAFDLIQLQGESYQAAAERFGCPIGTVKSRVNRARAQLSAELN